jgi:hypothetical protein
MKSPSSTTKFRPSKWLQTVCCIAPLGALCCVSVGSALGVQVNPWLTFALAGLSAKVIGLALGISPRSIILISQSRSPHLTHQQAPGERPMLDDAR